MESLYQEVPLVQLPHRRNAFGASFWDLPFRDVSWFPLVWGQFYYSAVLVLELFSCAAWEGKCCEVPVFRDWAHCPRCISCLFLWKQLIAVLLTVAVRVMIPDTSLYWLQCPRSSLNTLAEMADSCVLNRCHLADWRGAALCLVASPYFECWRDDLSLASDKMKIISNTETHFYG